MSDRRSGSVHTPSARPLRADARRNRERVLEAAHALFTSKGPSVAIDEVAARAGVGPGTVHRHFPTKQALVAAVVDSRVEQLVQEARTLADAGDSGAAVLRLVERMLDEGAESLPLKAALAEADFDIRIAAPDLASDLREALATVLANAQAAGKIRPELDVDDLLALVAGTFAALRHAKAEGDRERADRLKTVLFDGLQPGARRNDALSETGPLRRGASRVRVAKRLPS